eukprot:gene14309-biopygen6569
MTENWRLVQHVPGTEGNDGNHCYGELVVVGTWRYQPSAISTGQGTRPLCHLWTSVPYFAPLSHIIFSTQPSEQSSEPANGVAGLQQSPVMEWRQQRTESQHTSHSITFPRLAARAREYTC